MREVPSSASLDALGSRMNCRVAGYRRLGERCMDAGVAVRALHELTNYIMGLYTVLINGRIQERR